MSSSTVAWPSGRRLTALLAIVAILVTLVAFPPPAEADDTPLVDAPPINLTLNGVATQSSTYLNTYPASRAIDGNTNGVLSGNSVTHTNSELNAWWQVDLGEVYDIPVVKVFGRTDCCTDRLDNFSVFVSDTPFTSTDINATRSQPGVTEYSYTANVLTTVTTSVNRTGRYVRVQLHDTDFLHLAEVQIGGPTFEIQPDVIPSWGVRGNSPSLSENIDAEIFAIEQIGNVLYVGGRFEEAVATRFAVGQDQPFLMALDATTGNFISTFRPDLDGPVLALEATEDGSRLFVGGEFYSVNDEPNTGGMVALDPVTGQVQKDWTSQFDRYWAVAPAQVKAITIAGGYVYAGGNFTHATDSVGPRTNVYNVARFNLSTGRLDTSWRPTVSGGSVWGIAVSESWNRVYLGGKFNTVQGQTRESFAALTIDTAALTGPTSITRNVPPTGQDDIYDVVAVGDLVVIAGSEHSTIAYNAADFSIANWVFTNTPGGDNQDLEVVGDRIYSTCHCRGGVWDNYRPGSNWTIIAQGTYKGVVEGVYAISAKTGAFIDTFPYSQFEDEWVISAGPWAVHGAPDGCLWIGGDLNLAAIGGSYVNSLARVCLEGGPRSLGLTNPSVPPPDTTAPPAPNGATASVSDRTVTVTVTPPANTSDVAHYVVLRDGAVATKSESTTIALANQAVGQATYSVAAVDSSGNQSPAVTAGSVTVWPGSYDRFVDANFDNYFSGQEYSPFAFELGVFGGAVVDRAEIMYTPDGAPTDDAAAVVILGGKVINGDPAATNMAGALTTTFTLDEPTPVSIRFDRRLMTSAAMGTLYARMSVDGVITTIASQASDSNNGSWAASTYSLGTLPAGTHTVSLGGYLDSKSYSFANWWNKIAFDDVLIYSDKPGLEVLDAPTSDVSGLTLPVTIASRDFVTATSALTVRVTPSWTGSQITPTYNATTGLFTTDLSLVGVADGPLSYTVTVTDANGQVTTEIVNFTLQNAAPPTVSIDSPADGATVNGAFDVVVDAVDGLDPLGSLDVEASIDGATWVPAAWNAGTGRYVASLTTVGQADGPATIQARATDSDTLTGTASVDVTLSNAAPDYDSLVLASGPDAYWRLGEASGTVAVEQINGLNGTYVGGITLGWAGLIDATDTAVSLDGVNDAIDLPDSSFLNLRNRTEETVELWFSASNTTAKQVLYEQGGTSRGLNMYVSGGNVYVGGWNTVDDPSADTPWASGPAFVSAPIAANATYHLVLVYDQPGNRLEGFLDGVSIGTVTGIGQLYQAAADNGIGAMNDGARFHDSINGGDGFRFTGVIDEVAVYNKVLSSTAIAAHHDAGRIDLGSAPTVSIVSPVADAVLDGTVTVVVDAADAEDAKADLTVEMSTDGGGAWQTLPYSGGNDDHRLAVDTTTLAEGPLTIQVRVTDSNGLDATASVNVEIDNLAAGYADEVLAADPDAYWRLGDTAGTAADELINAIDGTYIGGVALGAAGLVDDVDTAATFDGVNDGIDLPDSTFLNLTARTAETVEVWFSATDTARRQVIYDQGGTSRGLGLYVDGGLVYVGGWNTVDDASADTPWASGPAFVSTPITANTTYHLVMVYDQAAGQIEGFLDGVSFGTVSGVGTLYSALADNGIGAMNDGTRFHDGISGGDGFYFGGTIDEVAIYNAVIDDATIAAHHGAGRGAAGLPPNVVVASPAANAVLAGTVTVALAASDPEDAAVDLTVEISTDGGAAWIPAPYSPGDGDHRVAVDTTTLPEGPSTIQARVTDTAGQTGTASVNVEIDNVAPGYSELVLADGPDAYWRLGDTAGTSAVEQMNGINGTYVGGVTLGWAGLVAGTDLAASFDGVDDAVTLPDSSFLNLRTRTEETVELWFSASNTTAKQVLYEQGGTSRGLSMYVSGGNVYVGGWNTADDASADTPWVSGPAFVSAPITTNTTYHLVLVYDQPGNRLEGFLNGVSMGTVTGIGTLYQAAADSGIGAMADGTRFHDSLNGGSGFRFTGVIDEVAVYNTVLSATAIEAHYLAG